MISFSPEHKLDVWAGTQQQTRKSFNPLVGQYQMPHKNLSQELSICQQIKVVWKNSRYINHKNIYNIFLFILQIYTLQKKSVNRQVDEQVVLFVLHKKQQNSLHPTHTGLGGCQIVEYSRLQWPGQLCVHYK